MPIRFELFKREARILSPLRNFDLTTQTLEHRKDPLTGRTVIVIKGRMDYVRKFVETDDNFLEDLAASTQPDCPFCPSSVTSRAPMFPPEIASEGRIQVGDAICFPSLFAHEDFNAIVVPTREHQLRLNEFSPEMLVNGFEACLDYFARVRGFRPEAKHASIAMNFLPPAGSTISHIHMQALASEWPFHSVAELIGASRAYRDRHDSSYWADLLEEERRLGERYLASNGNVHWLTSFAPLGLNEAQAIVSGKSSLDQLTSADLDGLADGMIRVLRFYHNSGIRSFNAAFYSGPLGEPAEYFDLGLRIVPRYGYKPRFVSDVWAMQFLLGEREVYESPEETCGKLRKYFA
jgi:galactose-1-phosphate uridylyltransferase